MSKSNRPHTEEKLSELTDCFAMLNQNWHFIDIEMEGEDISQKTMLQPQHPNTEQPGEMKQSGISKKIGEYSKHT